MAVSNLPIYFQNPNAGGLVQILPADTTAKKTIITAGANGTLVLNLVATSTDTSDRTVNFYITNGGTDYLIATMQVPLNSGNSATIAPLAVLQNTQFPNCNLDAFGNRTIQLKSGDVLKVACTTTVTASKALIFFAQGSDW